ncbi:MAG TPA: GntR family transcriptional regulator [Gammaproteobacteria bacterium]|nr:GntR family transcriptional regulator [Gammaproteobacteria bacterium]
MFVDNYKVKALAYQHQTSQTLADNLREELILAIIEGEIPQGAKVSEAELARRYGVSRGPLREAIRDLEGLRLVERKPHAGVRVVALDCDELQEIFTIREALEGMAARLAATEMSSDEISALRELLDLHESKVKESDGQSYFRQHGDLDFHLRILKGSGNQRLYTLMGDELYQLILMYRRQSSQRPSRPQRALEEHRWICNAIEARDPELAEMLMRRHIQGARNSLQNCIEETP